MARDPDTAIGGVVRRFPLTRATMIESLRSADAEVRERGSELLVESYWKPVYKYLRIRWRKTNEEAKDLTQSFFAHLVEKQPPAGVAFGFAVGLLLAFGVAAVPSETGKHYYFEIMLPGSIVGAIVGWATQRYGRTLDTAAVN